MYVSIIYLTTFVVLLLMPILMSVADDGWVGFRWSFFFWSLAIFTIIFCIDIPYHSSGEKSNIVISKNKGEPYEGFSRGYPFFQDLFAYSKQISYDYFDYTLAKEKNGYLYTIELHGSYKFSKTSKNISLLNIHKEDFDDIFTAYVLNDYANKKLSEYISKIDECNYTEINIGEFSLSSDLAGLERTFIFGKISKRLKG